jgi:hypothetical protein
LSGSEIERRERVRTGLPLSPRRLSKMCFFVALLMPRDRRILDLCMES